MSARVRSHSWRALAATALLVLTAGCAEDSRSGKTTSATAQEIPTDSTWLAEDIGGSGVIDRAQSTITFAANDDVSGSGGCNRYHGQASIAGSSIDFGPFAATMMACPPALMDQERRFFDALAAARSYNFDDPYLIFYDDAGRPLVKFTRQS